MLEFNQSQLKPYIELNTQIRIKKNEIETKINGRALYKLINNAINRKTMENF